MSLVRCNNKSLASYYLANKSDSLKAIFFSISKVKESDINKKAIFCNKNYIGCIWWWWCLEEKKRFAGKTFLRKTTKETKDIYEKVLYIGNV